MECHPDSTDASHLETIPTVSIVMATYNRSNLLRPVIECVRDSTFADWELIVIGDACTDDTEAVVASFADPRIRFRNLPNNCGEQTGPNNEGCRLARGKYIAFLNHDDLWFPDHLESAVKMLDSTDADLVFSSGIRIRHDDGKDILAVTKSGSYESHVAVPASLWVFRRELIAEVGPWRSAREIYSPPSQDWLFRAASAGKKLLLNPVVTVVYIPSGFRKNAYSTRAGDEHAYWRREMAHPDRLRAKLCEEAAVHYAKLYHALRIRGLLNMVRFRILCRILRLFNIPFFSLWAWISYRGRGGFVDRLRRNRGLPPLSRNDRK